MMHKDRNLVPDNVEIVKFVAQKDAGSFQHTSHHNQRISLYNRTKFQ
jgi:hypothetical protein